MCQACEQGLARDLTRLPGLYDECGRRLTGSHAHSTSDRTSGGPLPGMPFNTAAADVRKAILAMLSSWSSLVADERGLAPPARRVADLSRFLLRHVPWLITHAAAAEATHEIAALAGRARKVAEPAPRRRVRIGACVERDCRGELASVRPGEIACSSDAAHRWGAEEWTRLSRRLSSAGSELWLGAADISRLWRVPTGSVYRMASERGWRRRSQAGHTYYDGSDVERTLGER